MNINHTPEEVSVSIKEIIRQNYGSLSEYAFQKNITSTQLYNLLNWKEYISLFSAVSFSNDLDLNIEYCTKGILPIFSPEHDYKKLKKIAKEFFYAVKEEDDFREEFQNRVGNLSSEEINQFNVLLNKLRINKAKSACELADLLNLDIELEKKEEKKINLFRTYNTMTLHEAIADVLCHNERPLTVTEIASCINNQRLYSRKDGRPVPASQISARIRHYPQLFTVNRETNPQTINLNY